MTRAAAFTLLFLALSSTTLAQDAVMDSEAPNDTGGADTGGDDGSGDDGSGDDGSGDDGSDEDDDGSEDTEPTFGAADMAGEEGGCQGCATGEGLPVGAGALGLLLVGLSRRRGR